MYIVGAWLTAAWLTLLWARGSQLMAVAVMLAGVGLYAIADLPGYERTLLICPAAWLPTLLWRMAGGRPAPMLPRLRGL